MLVSDFRPSLGDSVNDNVRSFSAQKNVVGLRKQIMIKYSFNNGTKKKAHVCTPRRRNINVTRHVLYCLHIVNNCRTRLCDKDLERKKELTNIRFIIDSLNYRLAMFCLPQTKISPTTSPPPPVNTKITLK